MHGSDCVSVGPAIRSGRTFNQGYRNGKIGGQDYRAEGREENPAGGKGRQGRYPRRGGEQGAEAAGRDGRQGGQAGRHGGQAGGRKSLSLTRGQGGRRRARGGRGRAGGSQGHQEEKAPLVAPG